VVNDPGGAESFTQTFEETTMIFLFRALMNGRLRAAAPSVFFVP
jgi:hypothetical protein